jgi:NADH:ubiquinone oxidoreductase subunit F (NADH-binding)
MKQRGESPESAEREAFPLERVQQYLAGDSEAALGESGRRVARSLGLPPVRLRELTSFYRDLVRGESELGVCRGTSCFLAGGNAVAAACPEARGVHCLGHCDQSPCVISGAGVVLTGCRGDSVRGRLESENAAAPARPSLRCVAREPVITRNLGRADAHDLDVARRLGVYDALEAALQAPPAALLDTIERSGERGRGGAGFPTAAKWRAAARSDAARKVVIANGDEGDPGSFIDRVLLEEDPHSVLEGLALCGYAVGADEGIVFVRSEYPLARERISRAIADATQHGLLGKRTGGSGFSFSVRVTTGFGSYVGGEETALLQTLEGRAGEVRLRPPYPVERGLHARPTVVNNVETLVAIPWIVGRGPEAYRELGTRISSGTKALCLNAGFAAPGIVEVEFGRSLRTVIEEDAKTGADEIEAVLLGGPMGSLLFPEEWDVELCYGALAERGVRIGHGGLVAIPHGVNWNALLRHWLGFMANESCGKCVPCREGSRRARDAVETGVADAVQLDETLALIEQTSLCAFGTSAPGPARKLLAKLGAALLEKRT